MCIQLQYAQYVYIAIERLCMHIELCTYVYRAIYASMRIGLRKNGTGFAKRVLYICTDINIEKSLFLKY